MTTPGQKLLSAGYVAKEQVLNPSETNLQERYGFPWLSSPFAVPCTQVVTAGEARNKEFAQDLLTIGTFLQLEMWEPACNHVALSKYVLP